MQTAAMLTKTVGPKKSAPQTRTSPMRSEPKKIVFDLTEVLRASTGKLRYYGIARVTAEIGSELRKLNTEVRFCVHSPSLDTFFEVFPDVNPDGTVDLNVPTGIAERSVRPRALREGGFVKRLSMRALRRARAFWGQREWRRAGIKLPELDLNDATLVTCARPKLIVEYLQTIKTRNSRTCLVPLLHDMIPLHDLQQEGRSLFSSNFLFDNRDVIHAASMVLTNSLFTMGDVQAFSESGVLPKLPAMAAIPLVHECPLGTELSEGPAPEEPYILTVGAATGRKNLEAVFEAFLRLKREDRAVPLCVLAGAPRKRTLKVLSLDRYAAIRDRFVVRANPNQTDLVALYTGAVALVIGSRMEGWGLPAGEALWLGTPAICSTAPVFKEVCGDLGLYFDPDNPRELASHISQLMHNDEFRETHRAKIRDAKPKLRTWKHVASDLMAAVVASGQQPVEDSVVSRENNSKSVA